MVGKMALLVTVVTDDPAQIPIFRTCWLVAAMIISSQGPGCVDSSGRGGALRSGVTGVAIAMIAIAPTLLLVLAKSLGLVWLRAMKRHGSCLVRMEWKGVLVASVIPDSF